MKKHTEERFEDAIVYHLTTHGGYALGEEADYDPSRALEPSRVVDFIRRTQPKPWQQLSSIHGADVEKIILDSLCKELDIKGMLHVLRHGFKCYGRTLKAAVFAPNNRLNPDTLTFYSKNRLSVTRQLHYSDAHRNSLDLVLFINGLPVATAELKNPLSGQSVENAKQQYKKDRDPRNLIFAFKKRALVHFAVDQDLVFMTTRLAGDQTMFLPFNQGCDGGAGNPPAKDGGYRTAYLWEQVWQRDSLLEILGRFMFVEQKETKVPTPKGVKFHKSEVMIFPRFHQLDAVRRLTAHSRAGGTGHNYLVQHSAGSGKSKSIAWLAHHLASLHDDKDLKIYDSVVVITDRIVLDQQLQNAVYQFEHKQGVVQGIDEDTRQLVKALSAGTPIIITTLQKFPFVAETMDKLNRDRAQSGEDALAISTRGKRFAVIVDEAHSSQSGETAIELKGILNKDGVAEAAAEYMAHSDESEDEDEVIRQMLKRGRQPNLSFFAFTATPKYKTRHLFDEPGPDGKAPFHEYTMRQAIQEKFILDVLANYTTYNAYLKIIQATGNDPRVEKKKAARTLARFVALHPVNIGQKTEVMVEHFRTHVRHKIGGRAKAMVVTDSRLSAVRYKLAFDNYIAGKGYTDIKTLVAFSGSVIDPDFPDKSWTEVAMNDGIREAELPSKFDTYEYRVLLVAEKYQTSFDQPYLHTMYVDKRLAGIQAVQTLSRLNRMCRGKQDTFVLDFRNKREEILEAFKPYYGETPVDALTDPHHLYRLQHRIDESGLVFMEEVNAFCAVYFKPRRQSTVHDHAAMNHVLDKAVERFKALEEEKQEPFKSLVVSFRNLYGFLSQVIPYQDSDLEKLYTYLRFLLTKLPRRASGLAYHFEDEIELKFYRLQKISEGRIDLSGGELRPLKGPGDVGTGRDRDKEVPLSELLDVLNERFGTDFNQADQLFFDQIREEALADQAIHQAARVNTIDDFRLVFDKAFEGLAIDRMEGNEEIFGKLMGDRDFRKVVSEHLLHKVFNEINASIGASTDMFAQLSEHKHSSGEDVQVGHVGCNLYLEDKG